MLMDAFDKFRNDPKHLVNWNFLIVILILFFSLINRLIHWDSLNEVGQIFPYFLLLIPTYVIAICFRRSDAKVLVSLVAIEGVMVIVQWLFGVSTFDSSMEGYATFEEGALAYFQRPFGWSTGSSIMATKLFLAYLTLDFFQFKGKLFLVFRLVFITAIVFTFNRTVILSLGVFLLLSQIVAFIKMRYTLENAWIGLFTAILGGGAVFAIVVMKGQQIIAQLTRNTGSVELTGREYLWMDFYAFISQHLVFGNSSIKLWLDGYHAHNSYLELIATNGVFISIVYMVFIFRNMKATNWIYIIPILIFGLTQYAFFWGISLFDIMLVVFLVKEVSGQAIVTFSPSLPTPEQTQQEDLRKRMPS